MAYLKKSDVTYKMNKEIHNLELKAKMEYWPNERFKYEKKCMVDKWERFIRKNCS